MNASRFDYTASGPPTAAEASAVYAELRERPFLSRGEAQDYAAAALVVRARAGQSRTDRIAIVRGELRRRFGGELPRLDVLDDWATAEVAA